MAPVSQSLTRTLASGDIVVSLADIVERLGGKLSQTDIDDLLRAIVSKRKSEVRPGDLITSDLINQVLAELADLQMRVADLEKPTGSAGVRIDSLLPLGTRRIGDELHIIGSGFDIPSGSVVSVDGVGVVPRSGVDRDRELIINIPNLQGVTSSGRNVTLQVSNSRGTDLEDFIVFPALAKVPEGQVFSNYNAAPQVATIESGANGNSYTFIYLVQAVTNLDEDYDISANVSNGWAAVMVDVNNQPVVPPRIRLRSRPAPAGDTDTVHVRVTVPGGLANGTEGTLTVTATSLVNPLRLNGHSSGERIVVGAAPPNPLPIAVTFNEAVRTSPSQRNATVEASGLLRLGAGSSNYRLNFAAQIKAGTVYRLNLIAPLDPNPPAGVPSRWFASFDANTTQLSQNIGPVGADTTQQIFVFVHGKAGAPDGTLLAPDGTLVLSIVSTTDATQTGRANQRVGVI